MLIRLQEVIVPNVPWYVYNSWWITLILFVAGFLSLIGMAVYLDSASSNKKPMLWRSILAPMVPASLIAAGIVGVTLHHTTVNKWNESVASLFESGDVTSHQIGEIDLISMVSTNSIVMQTFPQNWVVDSETGEYVKDSRVIISDGLVVTVEADKDNKLKQLIESDRAEIEAARKQ